MNIKSKQYCFDLVVISDHILSEGHTDYTDNTDCEIRLDAIRSTELYEND